MYCKNCGKKLPDDARFCDRCNVSVRKKSDKMNLIGELKEERLARRKAKAIEERLKKIKKIKSRRRRLVFFLVLGVILLGVISAVVMYINIVKHSTFNHQPIEEAPVITDSPAPTESATAIVIGGNPGDQEPAAPSVNKDGYIVSDIKGKSFAYPGSFALKTENENTLVFEDTKGDARITAGSVVNSETPKATMMHYQGIVSEDGTRVTDGDTSYYITGQSGSDIYHRFGYIKDGIETYYEFIYPLVSDKKAEYEADIAYMDSHLNKD
ncbi:MAG: zinc ribbon domain-containing protein [Oscillospiraceae bacterium]|nr:zinc ribbon domain-containing protein [Oscillospiraceae bacterium]